MKPENQLRVVFLTAAVAPGPRAAPFGAARVVSALRASPAIASRTRVSIVEACTEDEAEALASKAMALSPEVLGLSLYSWNSVLLIKAAALLKARLPGILVVAGGPDSTANPERLVDDDHVDIAVAGEGEAAMVQIITARLEGSSLPGPVLRTPLLDPAGLPSPWLDGTLPPSNWEGAAVELTRGCPYRCSFCFESKGASRLRRFPLKVIEAEIAAFEACSTGGGGVGEVFVLDPTFNADSRLMMEAIAIFRNVGPSLRYYIELRAELLTAEQARALSSIECSVQIGLQGSDPEILAKVNRKFDPDLFSRRLRLLDEEGIIFGLDLIYGLPGDTLPGFKRSLDYALGLGPNHLDVFRLAVLPGTALYDQAAGHGLIYDPVAPYLVRSTPEFCAKDLDDAERLATALDIMYNRGRAVMWFRSVAILAKACPSTLMARFADYIDEATMHKAALPADAPHRLIEELQLGFLAAMFAEKPPRLAGAADAALDLVRVSGAWTRAFAEGESSELSLGWNPEDLLDYAMADIAEFAAESERQKGRWVCVPGADGPRFKKLNAGKQTGSGKKSRP
ncbi:B12-binding domain-containing radical SAM protein [Spirochaetota bacterium]